MWKCKLVVCLSAIIALCVTAEDTCSQLNTMEKLLEKMIRTELNFERLETNVEVVQHSMDTAVKSAVSQIETVENKMYAFEEDVAKKLEALEDKFNYTSVLMRKLAEHGISLDSLLKSCPDGWTSFESSCYFFGPDNLSWADAERLCDDANAYLVNIESERENNFLKAELRQIKAPRHWVGMTDQTEEDQWLYYPSGARVNYFQWGTSQPNNGRISNCAAIWESFQYLWVDEPCTNEFRPICEKRTNV